MLDAIAEETEQQDLSRESTTMETHNVVSDRGRRTLQRFSVDTNDSLSFDPCESSSTSPTGAEDGHDDDDVVFRDGKDEVRTLTQLQPLIY